MKTLKTIGETVTISRSVYERLKDCESKLNALYAAGVDNWEGYGEAFDDPEDEED